MKADDIQWFFLYEVFYCTSIIFVKLSIAFMLNRIAGNKRIFIYTNYGIMTLCASVNLAAILYIIFQCNPVEYVRMRSARSRVVGANYLQSGVEGRPHGPRRILPGSSLLAERLLLLLFGQHLH